MKCRVYLLLNFILLSNMASNQTNLAYTRNKFFLWSLLYKDNSTRSAWEHFTRAQIHVPCPRYSIYQRTLHACWIGFDSIPISSLILNTRKVVTTVNSKHFWTIKNSEAVICVRKISISSFVSYKVENSTSLKFQERNRLLVLQDLIKMQAIFCRAIKKHWSRSSLHVSRLKKVQLERIYSITIPNY